MININEEKVKVSGSGEDITIDIFRLFSSLKKADFPNLKSIVKVVESICGLQKEEEEKQEEVKQDGQEKTITMQDMRILFGIAGDEIAEERELDEESAEGLMDIASNLVVVVESYVNGTRQIDEEKYAICKEFDREYVNAVNKLRGDSYEN